MARFKTITVGGSWTGGGTQTPRCSATQQASINTALADVRTKVNNCLNLAGLEGLRQSMTAMLDCSLEVDCNGPNCASNLFGVTPNRGSPAVELCTASFSATQQRLNAVLFHEMIHAAGGTELDAEAFENHCYAGQGATAPTNDDFPLFNSDGAEWVIWDKSTCQLFVKRREAGSWIGDPDRITRGTQLTPTFCEPPPPATGGGSWI